MKKACIAATIATLACSAACAQERDVRKAEQYYTSQAYALAIPYYVNAQKGDSLNTNVLSHLGDCYRLTNDTKGQLVAYGRLVQEGKASMTQKLYYAEALTESGKFTEAIPYYQEYSADARGTERAASASKMA